MYILLKNEKVCPHQEPLAHLLPLLNYVDMDGSLLLETDIATGVTFNYGVVEYSSLNGTGVSLID